MTEKATALCHGAATIINAIALGRGAAFGVDLWTTAEVKLTDEPQVIEGKIISDPTEDPILIKKTVDKVLENFGLNGRFGAKVKTWSNVPIARGLKSSSAAANAVALAMVAALNKKVDDSTVINLGVDAAVEAKVTVTGAFDDACASYFGGAVITDNLKRRIVKHFKIADGLTVLFHVPAEKVYTIGSDVKGIKAIATLVKKPYKDALKGNCWSALTLNGLLFSSALGYNPSIAIEAILAGAVASGLSGKGPAVTALVPNEKIDSVKNAWQVYEGEILQAKVNHEKAKVIG